MNNMVYESFENQVNLSQEMNFEQSDSELQNGSITVGKTKQNRKSKKRN